MTEHEAGPELDRLVAEKVMGWPDSDGSPGFPCYWIKGSRIERRMHSEVEDDDWNPSQDIAHAWEVVKVLMVISYFRLEGSRGRWACMLDTEFGCTKGEADTAPLAICRAALKAMP